MARWSTCRKRFNWNLITSRLILLLPRRIRNPAATKTPGVSGSFVSSLRRVQPLRLRVRRILAVIVFLAAGVSVAAQTARENTASSCAGCHASQAGPQPQTPMGRALQWPESNPLFKSHPELGFRKGSYTYAVETKGSQTVYSVTDGTRTISLPIRWSFGKGAQTWVLEKDGELYESMVSYYPSIDGLEITTGDAALNPQSLDEAVGRKLRKSEPKDCFGCHSSNAVSNGE